HQRAKDGESRLAHQIHGHCCRQHIHAKRKFHKNSAKNCRQRHVRPVKQSVDHTDHSGNHCHDHNFFCCKFFLHVFLPFFCCFHQLSNGIIIAWSPHFH